MPGPKYPYGYDRIWHDIAAKLTLERPVRMTVTLPGMQASYARSTFNYFRHSWLRHYEFMQKNKDTNAAMASLDTYHRLSTYCVRISPPNTLIFSSKEAEMNGIVIETEGHLDNMHKDWRPQIAEKVEKKSVGTFKLKNTEGIPDYVPGADEEIARKHFRLPGDPRPKEEQVIPDNPPPSAQSANNEEYKNRVAFTLANGRPPNSEVELSHWLSTGEILAP